MLARLLLALERLGQRADAALARGDAPAFLAAQDRAAPLVARLAAECGPQLAAAADLRQRAQAWRDAQHQRLLRLESHLATLRDELGGLDQARATARRLRPAYSPMQTKFPSHWSSTA